MPVIAFLEGRLLAIDCVRETCINGNLVRLNKATFLISFGVQVKMGTMMFWGEEMNELSNLRLGQNYAFVAGLEVEEDLFLLYFLPQVTRFKDSR